MVISLKFRSLLGLTLSGLLISFSSFAAEKNEDKYNGKAPQVTTAEKSLGFWDLPYIPSPYISSKPESRNDGITVGDLVTNGGNKDMLVKLANEFADNHHGDYDSLLIAHKDKLLFESYYKRGRIDLPHFQSSATKGQTALVLGRAIQLGYLTMADLNKPLVHFLKGLDTTQFVDGVESITLHQAMTMSSGLRFTDEQMTKFRENPEQYKGLAQVQAFFELSKPINAESQVYKYQSPDPILVMNVLNAVVPGSVKDFIKNEFFDKLGISNFKWRYDLSGLTTGEGGLNLMSRDMLKVGKMVINQGNWNGEQLVPPEYLAKATSTITQATESWQGPETYFYGYLWYQTKLVVSDKSYDVKLTWGGGGNRIILIEDLDLVIVLTGHDLKDETMMMLVSNKILPAFIN